jgi:hypothetical protein
MLESITLRILNLNAVECENAIFIIAPLLRSFY